MVRPAVSEQVANEKTPPVTSGERLLKVSVEVRPMVAQSPYYVQSARIELRRCPAAREAYERLVELADASGVITLEGGHRGMATTLGCAVGHIKAVFERLVDAGLVAHVEFYPGEGGVAAEVQLAAPGIDPRSTNETLPARSSNSITPAPAPDDQPHQDAIRRTDTAPAACSTNETPHTPLYGTHDSESMCGGGGARMREGEPPTAHPAEPPEQQAIRQALLAFGVPADVAADLAPRATLAQVENLQASAAERATDPVAWVIAGIRNGRGKPPASQPTTPAHRFRRPPRGQPDPAAEEAERRASFRAFAERQAAGRAGEAAPPGPSRAVPYFGPPPPPPPAPPPPLVAAPLFDRSQRGSRRLGVAAERARAQRKRGTP